MNIFKTSTEALDSTLYISLNSNYAYFSIAKNACTLIKALLYQLEWSKASVPTYYTQVEDIHAMPPSVLVRPSQMSMNYLSGFLNDKSGRDLIILRDPRKRVLAAIRDKLTAHSDIRESIFYRSSLEYDPRLIITDDLIYTLHQRMRDLSSDIHFLPQFTIYSMIERSSPVILSLGTPNFAPKLEEFIADRYGVRISIDEFKKNNPWTIDHSTSSSQLHLEDSFIDTLIDKFYPMDISLWNYALNF